MPRLTLDSFRRVTSNGMFIPEIDGLRFIAILSVVLLHCYIEALNGSGMAATLDRDPRPMFRLLSHGGYGVGIFFAVSGFILSLPFARQYLGQGPTVRLKAYFLRRLTRLEPPYLLWILLRTLLLILVGSRPARFLLAHLLASLFYLHNLSFGVPSRIETVSWTLEIEVQFYCLAPLLALLYRIPAQWPRRVLLLVMIAGATPLQQAFLPGWNGPGNTGAWYLSILGFLQFFLAGLLVADLYVKGWERIPQTWRWDAVSLSLWLLMFWLSPHAFLFVAPLILPIVFVGVFKGRVIRAVLRHPVVSTIGGMCYSIYLTHRTTVLVLHLLLVRFHRPAAGWLAASLLLGVLSSFGVGAVYFLFIEKPCMDPRWPQKLMDRFRKTAEQEKPSASPSVIGF